MRLGLFFLALLAVVAVTSGAAAQTAPPPAVRLNTYSAYERDTIDDALAYLHAKEDPRPEGKIIEGIDILTLEVFERRDLVPGVTTIFNVFHTTTKRYVVEREILLARGEPFRQTLLDDTIRNLRGLVQLSLVLTLATQGSAPGRVRLVVITKDVWSLRPNWDIQVSNGGLLSLYAQPAETNLAGTHQTVSGTFLLQPNSVLLGGGYSNPRLFGTRLSSQAQAAVILNLPTGQPEGSTGYLVVGQPLYSPLAPWAWDAQATWSDQVLRRYVYPALGCYPSQATQTACATAEAMGKAVPFAYRASTFDTQYTVTRSWGWTTKHDVSLGVQVNRQGYPATPVELQSAYPAGLRYDPTVAQAFIDAHVPISDNRVGPFVQYHTYSKRYARLLDFETLGLQEDFRLGHNVFANVYPVLKSLGSTRDFVGFDVAAQYTWEVGDSLVRAAVESITEVETSTQAGTSAQTGLFTPNGQCPSQPGRPAVAGPVCDASIEPAVHVVSPTLLFGRLVFDAHLLYRFTNYLNQNEFLGGDTRMRGYPANYFTGYDILDGNLEYRTRSVDLLTAQIGLVAFYDVGQAWNGWGAGASTLCRSTATTTQTFCPVQGAGAGLRILFPQLDRIVFRTDLGFPLGAGRDLPGVSPVSFFFSLGQAFSTPAVSPGAGTGSTVQLPQISGSPTTALSAPP